MIALKTLLFSVFVPGTVGILIPMMILAADQTSGPSGIGALRLLGLVAMMIGAGFYLRCAWDFVVAGRGTPAPIEPPERLVVRGLYRLVRNPMYVGVLTLVCGEAIFFASTRLCAYAALLFLIFHTFVTWYEEPTLRRMFGRSYEQYCKTVPRWVPRIGRNPAGAE
jgi:protein-S-isoprenylcysteine O-methyltransferase Ste14